MALMLQISVHPSPNGEWMPERPLEPIMFEVHHTGDSFAPSAAESPQMMVYQSQSSQLANGHETAVLESVKTYNQTCSVESSHTVEVSQEVQVVQQNETLVVEKPDDFSDSEFEDGNESAADKMQDDVQALEPEKPRPMFSSEQVIISYEDDQPMIQPLENEEALPCEISTEIRDDEDAHLLSESQKDEVVPDEEANDEQKGQTKASAQSLELDSNGLPIGALIPLSGSNETVTSDNTTDDQPASEVFQDEPPRQPEPVEPSVCVIPNNYMMERLEISTEMNSDRITITEHYMNGDQSVNYEPTLQIAPCVPASEQYQNEFQMLNGSISETPRISQSDAGTDQVSTCLEDQHLEQDYLPNGTGNSTLEELSVDTNAPIDFDSTEAEFHSGSSNCAEFLVNSTPVDFSECENVVYVPRASTEIPSPSFPEPIEEVFMSEEEETEEVLNVEVDDVKEGTTTETEEEDTVKIQETRHLESGATTTLQVDNTNGDKTPSSSSSLNDPIIYIATAEEIAQAALIEATSKVADDEQEQLKTEPEVNVNSETELTPSSEPDVTLNTEPEIMIKTEPEAEPQVAQNSVHFDVEEENQPSLEEKTADKISFVDDVNTTESDKTSYDNTGLEEELLDYDETARSLERMSESEKSEIFGTQSSVPEESTNPPLANLDPIKGIFESESEPSIDKVFIDQPKETNSDEEVEPEYEAPGEVIQNMSVGELPENNNNDEGLLSQMPPVVPIFNPAQCPPPPVQTHYSEDTSSEDEDDEGLSAIEEEPSSITQDGEDDTPPPIPDRAMVPPPIPQRIPAAEPDQFAIPDVSVSVEDAEQLMVGCPDEPLSPITEKCGEETADEASPSIFSDKKESRFMCEDTVMSDSGSYDVNESESGANETTDAESAQIFGDPVDVDAMFDREMMFNNDASESLEPPLLPEREPVTPEDDIYISYGPGVSGTLVSEHAENDDYDIDDLIGPGPGSEAPPVDRSQKPQLRHSGSRDDDSSPCHVPSEVIQQMTENGSYSFDDEDGLHMVQGSYPDDDEAPGHYGSTGGGEEESVGERGESSDDVEERDCFGGAEGLESGDRTEDSAEVDSEEPEKPNMDITCDNPEDVQFNQHCDTEV